MDSDEYRSALQQLALDIREAGPVLGIDWRSSYRYAKGERPIPKPIALLLQAYLHWGLPDEWS